MNPLRNKWAARGLLLLGVALAGLWLGRLDYARKISTDLLDLIPADERSPELALARTLASERQARVALFALTGPEAGQRARAAEVFTESLRGDPAFAEVRSMADTGPRDALGRSLFARRFELLLPGWLAAQRREYAASGAAQPWPEWLAERSAARLERFLEQPEAMAFQELLPADPLLLLPGLVEQMPGFAESAGDVGGRALVWSRTSAAPLTPEGQEPVMAAVDRALAAARGIEPATTVEWAAIGRFAAESRHRIVGEVTWLNLLSFAAVLAMALLFLRRAHQALHLVPVVLGALLGAWGGTTLCFERVHALTFVVGSLLAGVAVDYGFYLFLQPPRTPDEPYHAKVRRVIKPLLASALTTVTGFSLLLLSELPLIRQLGVFVACGLVAALATALLWFAQVGRPFSETRPWAKRRLAAGNRVAGNWARGVLAVGALVVVAGVARLHWRDDIRELEAMPPELRVEAQSVRALFGETPQRAVYLTRGESPGAARAALAAFLDWHGRTFGGAAVASLGLAVPTPAEWAAAAAARGGLVEFDSQLRDALERHGFSADEFAPFFAAWAQWWAAPAGEPDAAVRGLAESLEGPLALTLSAEAGSSWFLTIAEHAPGAEPPPELATVGLDQVQSLNRLFSRYRVSALRLSGLGMGLVGLSVVLLYGWRRGGLIYAVPAGACLFAFGVLGLVGQPLNLFHLLGAFLGICLAHDYAIFAAENAARGEEPPPSIRLSALTTAASFGVLACSRIPVVAALGAVVGLSVIAALVAVELGPLLRGRDVRT